MSRYREQIAAVFDAVEIREPPRYSWLGRPSRIDAGLGAALDDAGRRRYLVASLREELYHSFYTVGRPAPARWGEPGPASPDPGLTRELARANTGRGSWEPGWTVRHVDGEVVGVATRRLRMRVSAADCRPGAGGLTPGAPVSVRLPAELEALAPGFRTFVGDAGMQSGALVRAYWNITAAGAPALVRALTARLNAAGTPFRLKVADHPRRFERADAAVLYLPSVVFAALEATLRKTADALRTCLRPGLPAFTLPLAPGVGLAEDPDGVASFGERRCAWLADALVQSHEQGILEPGARVEAVAARFAAEGVSIDAPYLEPSFAGRHVL